MTREEARQKADTIIGLFWHNFQKSEPAFIMRDVIAIALENANAQTELPQGGITSVAQPQQETAPLRLCDYCQSWNSKPCGEGCCWSPTDPTIEKVRADDLKAKQKHNRKHPLPVTFER